MQESSPNKNKKSIIIMIALIVMLVIGIIVRHNYIKSEFKETIEFYKKRIQND